MPLGGRIEAAVLAQRGHLFPWVPVCMAFGIGLYFGLQVEPPRLVLPVIACGVVLGALLTRYAGAFWAPFIWAAVLVSFGFALAMTRTHILEDPVLGWRYYGPVEGRVIGIDRSGSGATRITLDQVVMARLAPERRPERMRISLHGPDGSAPLPGATIIVTALLSPPGGPVEPGGFDFQRHAWFQKLGAVGYARTPLLLLEPAGSEKLLLRARLALSQHVQARLPGETGAFAAAIMTGDRAGMGPDTLEALRASNLAHLLAISGLHMGLLAGFVFAVVRVGLAAVPPLGLRFPGKKIAAVIALVFAAAYLSLSGGNVATERAFVMVAVALLAVIADRRAISLRAVGLAATIILILRPEALLGPGFQMSFAATTALVAVFGWLRDARFSLGRASWSRAVMAVIISSSVAGAATGPIGAAHFNQTAHLGLIANLISVPLMGTLIIPALVCAALLLPLGLDGVPLSIAGAGLDWILGVAHTVTGIEGSRGAVPSPDWFVLPVMAFGFLILFLWQGRLRFVGLGPVAVSVVAWAMVERPDVLIAEGGALVGVMGEDGRALSKARGAGFVATNWLENDGTPISQDAAAKKWKAVTAANPVRIIHVTGKRASAELRCTEGEIVVSNADLPEDLACDTFDPERMRATGAVALRLDGREGHAMMTTTRDYTGDRLWNTRGLRQ
ncbi:MAG: competence protein ComEC [Rhodobacteraceae bacterium HLUCCO07]|nr:MAG: competence protein ComEC [Rhodobacteraceae bacterium HLUCCO07]